VCWGDGGRAGDDVLSKVVNAAIGNTLLYERIMKPLARRTLINTVSCLPAPLHPLSLVSRHVGT
jgi:hypothetical protein